uniref:Uncharacterized protein n=1 Tax=Anguilla anguilla TaxID=7936 RepID=A0A0E9RV10_ANGAN
MPVRGNTDDVSENSLGRPQIESRITGRRYRLGIKSLSSPPDVCVCRRSHQCEHTHTHTHHPSE